MVNEEISEFFLWILKSLKNTQQTTKYLKKIQTGTNKSFGRSDPCAVVVFLCGNDVSSVIGMSLIFVSVVFRWRLADKLVADAHTLVRFSLYYIQMDWMPLVYSLC